MAAVYGLSVLALVSPLPIADLGAMLGFGGAFLIIPVMGAATVAIRSRREEVAGAVPVSPDLVAGMALLAIPLNAALVVLLASQSPRLFLVWLGALAVAGGYYLVRRRTADLPAPDMPPDS